MPTVKIPFGSGRGKRSYALLTFQEDWKPGDQPPKDASDYLGWHEWAEVQHKAGLRQKQCGGCGLWKYPQELSDKVVETTLHRDKAMTKPFTFRSRLCNNCTSTRTNKA